MTTRCGWTTVCPSPPHLAGLCQLFASTPWTRCMRDGPRRHRPIYPHSRAVWWVIWVGTQFAKLNIFRMRPLTNRVFRANQCCLFATCSFSTTRRLSFTSPPPSSCRKALTTTGKRLVAVLTTLSDGCAPSWFCCRWLRPSRRRSNRLRAPRRPIFSTRSTSPRSSSATEMFFRSLCRSGSTPRWSHRVSTCIGCCGHSTRRRTCIC